MRVLGFLFSLLAFSRAADEAYGPLKNVCIKFVVSSGTGCAWMCNYCAAQLGTNNYYFVDGICTYQQGQGCVGNPVAGNTYTCCSMF